MLSQNIFCWAEVEGGQQLDSPSIQQRYTFLCMPLSSMRLMGVNVLKKINENLCAGSFILGTRVVIKLVQGVLD